ncbi:MAG: hypothetical protein WBO16_12405 [Gammaproteobacteria bacterium]|jgi:hypothetical protein
MRFQKFLLLCCLAVCGLSIETLAAPASLETAQVTTIQIDQPAEHSPLSNAPTDSADQQESLAYESLDQLSKLTQIGLSGLAMRMIEQQQKLYPEFGPEWYAFEFKYFQTLSALERWQDIIDRADRLLDEVEQGQQITPKIAQWIESQKAIAWLQLGDAGQSLELTRKLIWEARGEDPDRTAFWRSLIIRAYLQLDYAEDANRALRKYRRDYGDLKSEWKLLQAQALLRASRPDEVVDLLAQEKSHKGRALRLLAAVRARPDNAGRYIKEIEQQLSDASLTQAQQRAYFYVLYEAYISKKNLLSAAETVEQLLALNRAQVLLGEHFNVNADSLWLLYEQIGEQAGNQYNLLKGNDSAWYQRAVDIQEKEPVKARAMYAVVALSTVDENKRQLAHKQLVDALAVTDGGLEVVNQLYMQSTRAGSSDNLPVEVRYRLVDHALSIGDITLAASMMVSLPEPPPGEGYFDWQMRKARVLILEGEYQKGEAELKLSLQNATELNTDMVDRYLQVVFDLQTIKRHKQALELFDLLPIASMDDKLKREIYYWKAESNYEIERYDQAAMLYMQSAQAGDETMSDLWAQSARFKASDALLKAKLYDDAQHAYSELLKITSSDARKRLIRQKLQHIRLLRSNDAESARGQADETLSG